MRKDYIENIEGAERRFYMEPVTIEARAEGDEDKPAVIEGYAALLNKRTNLGWMEEEILPGAFDNCLNNDVRCLFNHDPNLVLARSVNGKGTLELIADKKGLKYRYTTPNRTFAKDLADAIESGDVSQSSFAFRAKKVMWIEGEKGKPDLRQIHEMEQIYDVAPVTYPAYADTTVAKRSFDSFRAKDIEVETTEDPKNELDEFEARYMYNKNTEVR